MAKPLGPKSILIRDAIKANPGKGNTEIAELLNDDNARMDDKLKVKAGDVAQQRQAMKKSGEAAPAPKATRKASGNGRKKRAHTPAAPKTAQQPTAQAGPVDLIEKTLDLASQAGGVQALKKLVDMLADMRTW